MGGFDKWEPPFAGAYKETKRKQPCVGLPYVEEDPNSIQATKRRAAENMQVEHQLKDAKQPKYKQLAHMHVGLS